MGRSGLDWQTNETDTQSIKYTITKGLTAAKNLSPTATPIQLEKKRVSIDPFVIRDDCASNPARNCSTNFLAVENAAPVLILAKRFL